MAPIHSFFARTAYMGHAVVAVCVGVAGYMLHQAYGPPAFVVAEVDFALIEPASGGAPAADGPPEHKEVKSSSGKVLNAPPTLPEVIIGGKTVVDRTTFRTTERTAYTPPELTDLAAQGMFDKPFKFKPYAHNPRTGPADAAITIVEFTDLACTSCMEKIKQADDLRASFVSTTAFINVHAATTQLPEANLPAFYSKVAQRQNVFWQYRKALVALTNPAPEDYLAALMSAGADRLTTRRLMMTEARRFYRELDSDARMARGLNLSPAPVYLINGIWVGTPATPLDKMPHVLAFQTNVLAHKTAISADE